MIPLNKIGPYLEHHPNQCDREPLPNPLQFDAMRGQPYGLDRGPLVSTPLNYGFHTRTISLPPGFGCIQYSVDPTRSHPFIPPAYDGHQKRNDPYIYIDPNWSTTPRYKYPNYPVKGCSQETRDTVYHRQDLTSRQTRKMYSQDGGYYISSQIAKYAEK